MDLTHTTWILLITAVVLVKGDECPHADPQARSMTCIKDLPSVQYKPVATTQTTTDASGLREAREKRQTHSGSYNATSVEEAPSRDTMPPSTPDITREFIEYFCSESGVKMVHCAKELIEKCSDHPSMREALFNPVQALKAQSLCSRYMTPNFNETVECVNDVMSTERLAKCIFMAHSGGLKHMCRTTAEIYNCFVGIIGAACGREKVGFVVAVMRSMEPIGCRPIVDSVYADPIQWTSSSTLATPLSSLLMLIIVTVTFSLKRL